MNFFKSLFFLLATFCLLSAAHAEPVFVKRVIDGDTFVLNSGDKVRMIGIDTPEIDHPRYGKRGEPFGDEATQILKGMIERQDVTLKFGPEPFDKYDRVLAFVYLKDGTFVNRRMIELGAAEAYRKFPHEFRDEFIRLEAEARKKQIGMFHPKHLASKKAWWKRLLGLK